MKTLRLVLAVSALIFVAPSFASSADCNGVGNCSDNHSINNAAAGGAGGAGGSGTGGAASATAGGGSATGGSAINAPITANTNTSNSGGNTLKIEKGAVDIDNKNENKNSNSLRSSISNRSSNKQQQKQHQSQEANSSSDSSAYSDISESGNSQINYQRNTASAYAAALVASQETCVQGQSAGAQGPAFGISLGLTHTNEGCERRRNAALLSALDKSGRFLPAAIELMCGDDDVRTAMKAAGTPCAADRPQGTPTAALMDGAEAARIAAFEPMSPVRDDK